MKNKTIEWMNKKYQLKELKQEWIKFYREEYYYNGEDGEDGKGKERTDKHFDGFGNMMTELLDRFGFVSNWMWDCVSPSGTEDRTWYRVYQMIEDKRGKINPQICDGICEFNMVLDLYEIGWVDKLQVRELIEWKEL